MVPSIRGKRSSCVIGSLAGRANVEFCIRNPGLSIDLSITSERFDSPVLIGHDIREKLSADTA